MRQRLSTLCRSFRHPFSGLGIKFPAANGLLGGLTPPGNRRRAAENDPSALYPISDEYECQRAPADLRKEPVTRHPAPLTVTLFICRVLQGTLPFAAIGSGASTSFPVIAHPPGG